MFFRPVALPIYQGVEPSTPPSGAKEPLDNVGRSIVNESGGRMGTGGGLEADL